MKTCKKLRLSLFLSDKIIHKKYVMGATNKQNLEEIICK